MAQTKTKERPPKGRIWRCVNEPFFYCDQEPEWKVKPHSEMHLAGIQTGPLFGGSCKLDATTCEHRLTLKLHHSLT